MRLAGWGGWPAAECRLTEPRDADGVAGRLGTGTLIARGAGRAYGDSALNPALTLSTTRLNRMLGFDPATGVLTAEAGVRLADIVDVFLPRGWFPAVVPGTRRVTLGGMIAADVHGKNHRRDGSFGGHVPWLDLMGADGAVRRLVPGDPLFEATVGGMGLTGIVLRAALRLRPVATGWLRQRTLRVAGIEAAMAALEEAESSCAIGWIDCLAAAGERGRALVHLGEPAAPDQLGSRAADPFAARLPREPDMALRLPARAVRAFAVRAMNARRWLAAAGEEELIDWRSFFFPLDALGHWNRLYGPAGLLQYQFVLPPDRAVAGMPAVLDAAMASGEVTLATLKRFGPGRDAATSLSFPREGFSLALDFPVTRAVLDLLGRLDRMVLDHGGRFYLAKDARLPADAFRASEPRLDAFRAVRAESGVERFVSMQSRRLGI